MNKPELTKKQEEIFKFLKAYIEKRHFPPSVREICKAVELKSTSSVHMHLESLEKKGYIRRDPAIPRAIEILEDTSLADRKVQVVNVPIIGQVAAGAPILAEQNIENYFPVPEGNLPRSTSFMLRVKGESMINVGIFDGDLVLVEETNVADNGDLAVALVGDSATVKTFYKENGHFRLQPENDTMEPIIVDDVSILGKVRGVFRFL
ncbi:MAG: transcriptional repressor LexA [Lachnospiraceae bacterium]|jgi:repressor LexA|nr:transcriptional repressor LexA [Lachnospiraceae bacterium]